MKIPSEIRRCVAFTSILNTKTNAYDPNGTVFFVGQDPPAGTFSSARVFAVTAKHNVTKIRDQGFNEIFLRQNKSLSATFDSPIGQNTNVDQWKWLDDISVDVAVCEIGVPHHFDELVIPFSIFSTPEKWNTSEIDLGDETLMVGLFRHHIGTDRNIPIVRIGNLAASNEERVSTKLGPMDAYLIEARSIAGLSGSPVFINFGVQRITNGELKTSSNGAPLFQLIGLVHGHFDEEEASSKYSAGSSEALSSVDRINTGIAIVTPIEKVAMVLKEKFGIDVPGY